MPGYKEQWDRVQRYYDRFQKLNNGMEQTKQTVPLEAYLDDVYTFFQNSHHLKDWLINDSAYTKHTKKQIEDYVSKTQALSICADICNGSKHLFLDDYRSGDVPKLGKKVITVSLTDDLSGKEIPTKIGMQVEIEHAGNKLDAFQLATDVLQSWKSFI